MGRPKREQVSTNVEPVVDAAILPAAEDEAEVLEVIPVKELMQKADLTDLGVDINISKISIKDKPGIVLESTLNDPKTETEPNNPVITANSFTNKVKALSSEDLKLIKELKDSVDKVKAKQDALELIVLSLRDTVIDFLDALNGKAVLPTNDNHAEPEVKSAVSLFSLGSPIMPTVAPVSEEEEEVVVEAESTIEGDFRVLNPKEELVKSYPSIEHSSPDKLGRVNEALPKRLIETIKASPNKGTPKDWARTFTPKIVVKFPEVTENDVLSFLVNLEATNADGIIDSTLL